MPIDVTAAAAEVANNSTLEGSVVALMKWVAARLLELPPPNNAATEDALKELIALLSQNDTPLSAAVVANTPGQAATTLGTLTGQTPVAGSGSLGGHAPGVQPAAKHDDKEEKEDTKRRR